MELLAWAFHAVWLCALGRSRKILRRAAELSLCPAMRAMHLSYLEERLHLAMVEARPLPASKGLRELPVHLAMVELSSPVATVHSVR